MAQYKRYKREIMLKAGYMSILLILLCLKRTSGFSEYRNVCKKDLKK